MIGTNLKREIDQIAKDKGIESSEITGALEEAMLQAARKRFRSGEGDRGPKYNDEIGEVELFEFREVVEDDYRSDTQILIAEAKRDYDPEVEAGDEIGVKLDTSDFGRILAQAAKQVIIQRIRDAERDNTYDEYQRPPGRGRERHRPTLREGRDHRRPRPRRGGDPAPRSRSRARATAPATASAPTCVEVNKVAKGPADRALPHGQSIEFLVKLFEQEVPEMYEKIVSIESAAREPGGRSKIAVVSRDSDVDPVGACVGMKGSRVQAVVQELRGERIDIVPWSPDTARYVCSALSPAQVSKVIIDESPRSRWT